ncbi:BTAD domain-containing putative transcriptional regulator [Streptomyces zaomyceticus]|uniref:BTAD domain-containing putative transcriptional regulator n=1 Tax=Streptomyces zaomyceticus TaxID=68286 RepID=UPI00368E9E66
MLFERSVERAHELFRSGDPTEALHHAEEALALWRGDPYDEARHTRFAQLEIARLNELHTGAAELRARLLLDHGAVTQAIAAAEALVVHDELREAAWVVLLRALYSAGRAAEALRRYETVRQALAEDLGVEPGPDLRRTHLAILRHDVGRLLPGLPLGTALPARQATPQFPVSCPPPTHDAASVKPLLVGREQELNRLLPLLSRARQGEASWAVISGEAGIGKTRLAEQLADAAAASGFTVLRSHHPKHRRDGGVAAVADEVTRHLDALRHKVRPQAGPPVLCLVEDVQGAGPRYQALLADRAEVLYNVPLLLVCTASPDLDDAAEDLLAALARRGAEHVTLGPLDEAGTAALLRVHSPDGSPAGDWCAEAYRLSGGNPLLLVETARARQGMSPSAIGVPPAVRHVVRRWTARLSSEALRIVESAAVGSPDVSSLARLHTVDPSSVIDALGAAVRAGLLIHDARGYTFSSVLARVVVAEGVPASQRSTVRREAVRSIRTVRAIHRSGGVQGRRSRGRSRQLGVAGRQVTIPRARPVGRRQSRGIPLALIRNQLNSSGAWIAWRECEWRRVPRYSPRRE